MVSAGMLLALASGKPYVDDGDDRDAVIAQMVRVCKHLSLNLFFTYTL